MSCSRVIITIVVVLGALWNLQSQTLPHTFDNGVTLKKCEMERCYEIFPTVPRRNLIVLDMPEFGTYYGYYKSMKDEASNVSYTCSDFVSWDVFPTRDQAMVRGYVDSYFGDIPVIYGVPGFVWDTIKEADLIGTWTEIEPYSFSWYGMDKDNGVSVISQHTFSFYSGGICKESYSGFLEGCAIQRVGDTYHRRSHSWYRSVKGGYYFKVTSDISNNYKFSYDSPTLMKMECTYSDGVKIDVNPIIDKYEYEESYRDMAIQQIRSDLASNDDVKKAETNHKNWLVGKHYPKRKGDITRFNIYKLSDDVIVLYPLEANHNTEMDYEYYIILKRTNE